LTELPPDPPDRARKARAGLYPSFLSAPFQFSRHFRNRDTGSGTVRIKAKAGNFFEEPVAERVETRRGSATIALDIEPHFDRLIFMDQKQAHCAALETRKEFHSGRAIH
jgi:hypothetical protein